jgi:hypothetical protein
VARQTKPMVIRMNTKKIHWLATIQTSPPYFRITHVLFATAAVVDELAFRIRLALGA